MSDDNKWYTDKLVEKLPAGVESLYVKDSIRTVSGKYVNVFDTDPDTIVIEDIAHALAHQPRFGGHLSEFYSVAQHSISCYLRVVGDDAMKFAALMHDASEAYLLDMPKPIKMNMPQYNEVEDKLMTVISNKFGFIYPKPKEVGDVDRFMLEREWAVLMLKKKSLVYEPIRCMSPYEAKKSFLKAFYNVKDCYNKVSG